MDEARNLTPDALRASFPSGAFVNLIMESGGTQFPSHIPVPDAGSFVLYAPCDGRLFLGIYRYRHGGDPDIVCPLPEIASKGQRIHFG